MKEFDSLDYGLLWELIKDSRRSDRQLAKFLGMSQPTITRRRARVERIIDGYTAIPKFPRIGFELVAFTFVKSRVKYGVSEKRKDALKKTVEWFMKQPNVVFSISGQGMGWDGVCISFHKNYTDFAKFVRKHDSELSDFIVESQTFIADINSETVMKPFHFEYLADVK
jgi:DNA-binding Lrp family transcriptional regulator